MDVRSRSAAGVPGALIALGMIALGSGAQAQEFCVSCKGPDASYRCVIGGEGTPAARSSRGQFLCITELAKAGGHANCSVARSQTAPCPGETRSVMFSLADPDAQALGQPQPGGDGTAAPPSVAPPTTFGSTQPPLMTPVGSPPHTAQPHPGMAPSAEDGYPTPVPPDALSETDTHAPKAAKKPGVMQDMATKTGKALNDTGNAVGSAVKKSWDCVTSFFGKC